MKILIPKEHGAWAMLYAPLIIALIVSRTFSLPAILLILAITAIFFAHSPLFILARLNPEQSDSAQKFSDARKWLIFYAVIATLAAAPLILIYRLWFLVPFGVVCALLLGYQTYVSARREEKSILAEFLVVISLTSSAPALLYVVRSVPDLQMLLLWILSILFFASSIFYVKMRVSLHVKKAVSNLAALQCMAYHLVLCAIVLWLIWKNLIPTAAGLAFLPIIFRAIWSFQWQPKRLSLKRIGVAEIVWTVLFVVILSLTF